MLVLAARAALRCAPAQIEQRRAQSKQKARQCAQRATLAFPK
jgi:hypothetical protein